MTKLTYWSVAGAFPEFRTTGEILQSDLASIGIDMKIEEKEVSSWVEPFYPPGKKFPGYVIPNFLSFSQADPLFILNFWTTGPANATTRTPNSTSCTSRRAGKRTRPREPKSTSRCRRSFYDDVPSIQLAQSTGPAGVRKEVTGVWVQPGGRIRLEDAALTQ